ncbi:MAG: phosphoribosylglycinamide formyltransferase [Chitinophagaceae bacterium]|nr:phosphoribosylglycinamide formyltransferase [Chitinophagaceae bacterium]
MLSKLQQKWKVSGSQVLIIIIVFACTGLTTAYLTKTITHWFNFDESDFLLKLLLRLAMLIFGYQVVLLFFGALFGQWNFFWTYEKKLLRWMRLMKEEKQHNNTGTTEIRPITHIAIFASGAGSNAKRIIEFFDKHPFISVSLVVTNKKEAGVLHIAAAHGIPSMLIEKEIFFRGNAYVDELNKHQIDFIVLAGFLWKIPATLIKTYPSRIINIHPALLPRYGGKGMYGHFVHDAVIAAKETESGITIHLVDEHYDNGKHLLQVSCPVMEDDTAETLYQRIQQLEHKHFPEVIEACIKQLS